jgi:hypothetical protein
MCLIGFYKPSKLRFPFTSIGLQSAQRDVHVLAKCLPALVELHHTTSRVVLAMPNDLIAGGLVQDQSSLPVVT